MFSAWMSRGARASSNFADDGADSFSEWLIVDIFDGALGFQVKGEPTRMTERKRGKSISLF